MKKRLGALSARIIDKAIPMTDEEKFNVRSELFDRYEIRRVKEKLKFMKAMNKEYDRFLKRFRADIARSIRLVAYGEY